MVELVPRLEAVEECVAVPREVCRQVRSRARRGQRPSSWQETPGDTRSRTRRGTQGDMSGEEQVTGFITIRVVGKDKLLSENILKIKRFDVKNLSPHCRYNISILTLVDNLQYMIIVL